MKNKLAENLKQLRLEEGLSQKELAIKACVTQRSISYWESGTYEPDLDSLILLAQYFKVSTDYLLGLEA